jgi:Bacterial regulatory proteins, luxR family
MPESEQTQQLPPPRPCGAAECVLWPTRLLLLGISDGTVKNHLSDILRKLEARDRTHAVLKAIAARML